MIRHSKLFSAIVVAGLLGVATSAAAADVRIINKDAAGVGLNDLTPTSPVGGNQGTTRGEQARIVFTFAANMWGAVLKSDVPVMVDASFKALQCDPTGAGVVLGSTGTLGYANFTDSASLPAGAKLNIWYPGALVNMYLGTDATPTQSDMSMSFNGALGTASCLPDSGWYFGLDGNTPSGQSNLLNVMLHEMGHGLGFAGRSNLSTGALSGGKNDIYSSFVYDDSNNAYWGDLTNAQRKASALKDGMLVMRGANVVTEAPLALGKPPVLKAIATAGTVGEFEYAPAAFGPVPTAQNFAGSAVVAHGPDVDGADSTQACYPLTNAADIAGHVAIVDRGVCGFAVKARFAEAAGATGVIIANNAAGVITAGGDTDPNNIPTLMVSDVDGATLKQNAAGLTVSLGLGQGLAGADAAGNVKIYAPAVLASGSSFSHYDTRLSPNALMEYAESPDLEGHINLDLTPAMFKDEGWGINDGGQLLLTCNTGIPTWIPGGIVIGANVLSNAKMIAGNSATVGDYRAAMQTYAADLASKQLITSGQATSLNDCLSNAETLKQFNAWSPFAPVTLQKGLLLTAQSGNAGSSKVYTIDVPAGAVGLSLRTLGGGGDVSIYVKVGEAATASSYTYKSAHANTSVESVAIARPTAGTYYVTVVGETDYSGVTVFGNFTSVPQ